MNLKYKIVNGAIGKRMIENLDTGEHWMAYNTKKVATVILRTGLKEGALTPVQKEEVIELARSYLKVIKILQRHGLTKPGIRSEGET